MRRLYGMNARKIAEIHDSNSPGRQGRPDRRSAAK
jgi:hypothetical protein